MLIELRNTETGEIRDISAQTEFHGVFIWEDGNYACDCNRKLFFERAIGVEPQDDAVICGHDKFAARITEDDGSIRYIDGENWPILIRYID